MLNITISQVRQVPTNPNMPQWEDANHYKVQLKGANGKRFSLYYSKGLGHKDVPQAQEVVETLLLDLPMYDMGLVEFMTYACIDDVRDAQRIMRTIEKNSKGLIKITNLDVYELMAIAEEQEL